MTGPRTYDDACPVAVGLDLIGERWSLLIVRELILGSRRFSDLRVALPGVSPDVLSQRLRGLQAHGIVARRKLPPPAGSQVYELTAWGRELDPLVLMLAAWTRSSTEMGSRARSPISADSLLLSFRVRFDPSAAEVMNVHMALHVDAYLYELTISHGSLQVQRTTEAGAGLSPVITTDTLTLAEVLNGASLDDAVRTGRIEVSGDPAVFAAVLATLA